MKMTMPISQVITTAWARLFSLGPMLAPKAETAPPRINSAIRLPNMPAVMMIQPVISSCIVARAPAVKEPKKPAPASIRWPTSTPANNA